MTFEVVLCQQCHNPWVHEHQSRRSQDSSSCPNCGKEHTNLKVIATQATREGAAEARSRYLASRAENTDVYQTFQSDIGQYNEQVAEIERQIDQFVVETDLLDLTPIEADRYEEFVDDTPIHTEWFSDQVSDRPVYADAFADAVDDETQSRAERNLVEDRLSEWVGTVDVDDLPRGKVIPTNQKQLEMPIEIGDEPVTDIWEQLFELETVRSIFESGLEEAFAHRDVCEVYDDLESRAIPFWIRSSIVAVARGKENSTQNAVDEIATLTDAPLTTTEHLFTTAAVVNEFDTATSLSVRFTERFFDRDYGKRVAICDLLAILASGIDIRIVGTGRELWKVNDAHRADLPGISEFRDRPRDATWFNDVVDEALEALDPDKKQIEILRELASEPGHTLPRAELEARFDVSSSRMTQLLTSESVPNSLESLQLIDVFGARGQQQVALRETGHEILETFAEETTRQQRLDAAFNATGKSSQQCRRTPRTREGGGGGQPYLTTYMDHDAHAAAAATAESGCVVFVDGSLPDNCPENTYRKRPVSYNAERNEVVVAPTATTPFDYTVTTALGLADPLFLDKALPVDQLEEIDEPTHVLSAARQIGPVTADSLDSLEQLRDDLIEWGETIEEMTDRLDNGDYADRNKYRGEILKSAKGLEGSIIHLLDATGIEPIREVRLKPKLKNRKLHNLAKSLGISAAIASKYGCYAAYRQLFDVPSADPPLSRPTVDATDPTGELIGSFVIRGPEVHRIRDDLEFFLSNPRELLDDSALFTVEIPVLDVGREAYQEATSRVLWRKRLRTTPEAISLFHALVESPHDMAWALLNLPREDRTRDLRPDDVRYALSTLESDVLLPGCGSAGALVKALLEANETLSQTELATRAGVTTRTVRNYQEKLEAMGLIDLEDGYRLMLSMSNERSDEVLPDTIDSSALEIADRLLTQYLPTDRYTDPEDPLGGLLFWPTNPFALREHDELRAWFKIGVCLSGTDLSVSRIKIAMGPALAQQPLPVDHGSRGRC